ncbi:KRAB-A domain-containing protein 2-like [Centruroides vittatus]|uniref:KRAB-A domain-containing protein 2-like n=1 Tax=Centruroides vittatus TaxID=120091 RepID=UPI00350EED00
MADSNQGTQWKEEFLKRIIQIDKHEKKEDHYNIMTKESYDKLMDEIEEAQLAEKKTQKQYRRLNRFKVINNCGTRKLVTRKEPMKYYLYVDEIFDILEAAHVAIGHGGRDRLKNETSRIYANITREMISIFLSMCKTCQRKKSMRKMGLVSKPILHSEMNSRCQVDLIDMQMQEDHGFKFIMVYQDHLTKFVLLRALQSKRAVEVAHQLTDIFSIFGAPCILHSNNGREFVNSVVDELASFWPECKLVHGKPRHSQSQESANQDIEKMLASWMHDNNTTNWSNGLRFVQFMKNCALHSGIKQSPYKAMFGTEPQVGLTTSSLPLDIIREIRDEDDLKEALNKINVKDEGKKAPNDVEILDVSEDVTAVASGSRQSLITIVASQEDPEAAAGTSAEPQIIPASDEDPEVVANANQQTQIIAARENTHLNLAKQAQRMKLDSDSIHPPVEISDNIIIPIPDVDRAKPDLHNIIGVILQKDEQGLHKIGTKYGIFDKLYCRSEFDRSIEKFFLLEGVPKTSVSLRTAARRAALGTGQGFVHCLCKKACMSKRCFCKKKGNLCNSKCHDSLPCNNK